MGIAEAWWNGIDLTMTHAFEYCAPTVHRRPPASVTSADRRPRSPVNGVNEGETKTEPTGCAVGGCAIRVAAVSGEHRGDILTPISPLPLTQRSRPRAEPSARDRPAAYPRGAVPNLFDEGPPLGR
jgi:hypothetical protein